MFPLHEDLVLKVLEAIVEVGVRSTSSPECNQQVSAYEIGVSNLDIRSFKMVEFVKTSFHFRNL